MFVLSIFFFFNDTATTEIYTLSLHDALPISRPPRWRGAGSRGPAPPRRGGSPSGDRKSTRLNSSHGYISYAVFCLKKKKTRKEWSHHRTERSAHRWNTKGAAGRFVHAAGIRH